MGTGASRRRMWPLQICMDRCRYLQIFPGAGGHNLSQTGDQSPWRNVKVEGHNYGGHNYIEQSPSRNVNVEGTGCSVHGYQLNRARLVNPQHLQRWPTRPWGVTLLLGSIFARIVISTVGVPYNARDISRGCRASWYGRAGDWACDRPQ